MNNSTSYYSCSTSCCSYNMSCCSCSTSCCSYNMSCSLISFCDSTLHTVPRASIEVLGFIKMKHLPVISIVGHSTLTLTIP